MSASSMRYDRLYLFCTHTRWRYAFAFPNLNHPPCRCRIVSSERTGVAWTRSPVILPAMPDSNITSSRGRTPSINASNGARADPPQYAFRGTCLGSHFNDGTASAASSGCITMWSLNARCVVECSIGELPLRLLQPILRGKADDERFVDVHQCLRVSA